MCTTYNTSTSADTTALALTTRDFIKVLEQNAEQAARVHENSVKQAHIMTGKCMEELSSQTRETSISHKASLDCNLKLDECQHSLRDMKAMYTTYKMKYDSCWL